MPLTAGQTLSFYKVLGPLGAGGMGEVYKAQDTRLEREVALKVLPEELAGDEERLRRFEREAKTLASLNHPNVAGVHGIDQVDETCFIAMELVPGEDLGERLKRGALPVDEALDVCRQIAEGLEAAHEAGVVHRDLKPANVRITPDGIVKVLDFGLAKPIHPKTTKDGTTSAESDSFLMTEEGMVLGTPTYMSPEQARGRPVDRRTDIWAFGCVLYECLIGKRAFGGQSLADIMGAIVSVEPDWSRLPSLPPRVGELLRRTLAKDPRVRLRDIGEARVLLLDPGAVRAEATAPTSRRSWFAPAAGVLVLGGALGGLAVRTFSGSPETASAGGSNSDELRHPVRLTIAPIDIDGEAASWGKSKISPDGRHVASTVEDRLIVRSLDVLEPVTVLAEYAPQDFFWSPDSQAIAYDDDGEIFRVSRSGGRPTRIADTETGSSGIRVWLDDGRLGYVDQEDDPPRFRTVFSNGQEGDDIPDLVDEESHDHGLCALPGGGVLAVMHTAGNTYQLVVTGEGEPRVLLDTDEAIGNPLYAPGHAVFVRGEDRRDLWALAFSPETLEPSGEPFLVIAGVRSPSVSADGTLLYTSVEGEAEQRFAWASLDGSLETFGRQHGSLGGAFLSWDEKSLFFFTRERGKSTLWKHDLERGVSTECVTRDNFMMTGFALPDGRVTYIYAESISRRPEIDTYVLPESGHGAPELWRKGWTLNVTRDMSLALVSKMEAGETRFAIVELEGDAPERELMEFQGWQGIDLTPDERWMTYVKSEQRRVQLYVTRFPGCADAWQVSVDGADSGGVFSSDGTAIFYNGEEPEGLYRVSFQGEPELRLGAPELILEDQDDVSFHPLTIDGERFLATQTVGSVDGDLIVVLGWAQELAGR